MTPAAEGAQRVGRATLVCLAAIVVAAVFLRAYRLGVWPLADDEIFTLRDSRIMAVLEGPKPLLFFLNHHLFGADGLNELTMRILPAVFGVLSVPAIYWVTRRVATPAAGLVAALLVALHPEHVYWSQFARYHTLVFLMVAIYPFAFYRGVRQRSVPWIVLGAVTAGLGGLAHPAALLPLGAVGIWAVYELFGRAELSRRHLVRAAAVASVIGAATLVYALPILRRWIALDQREGYGSIGIHVSHLNALTPALVIVAALGVLWLAWDRLTRSLGILLALWAIVPALFLSGVALFASVYTGYLWPTAPPFFIAGAIFVDRCAARESGQMARRLVPVALVALLVVTPLPSLLSHYMDGSRVDLRSPVELVLAQARPGDVVLADGGDLPLHYLGGAGDITFGDLDRDETVLARTMQSLAAEDPGADLWIIAAYEGRGGIGDRTLEGAGPWIWAHCHQVATFGRYRLDYKYNASRVHRCPASHEVSEEGNDVGRIEEAWSDPG